MPLPKLEIGLIVQYEYLWHRRRDALNADKDHPACIVVTFRRSKAAQGTSVSTSLDHLSGSAVEWDDYVVYLPISQ